VSGSPQSCVAAPERAGPRRDADMVRNTLAFVTGVLILHALPALPRVSAGWTAAAAVVAICLTHRPTRTAMAALLCGFAWAWINAEARLAGDLPAALEGRDVELSGCVASLPEYATDRVRFDMAVQRAPRGVPHRIALTWYRPQVPVRAGQCLELQARLRARRGLSNPGGFDYEAYLLAAGIGATGYVRRLHGHVSQQDRIVQPLLRMREHLSERVALELDGTAAAGIVRGLAVGDRQAVSSAQWHTLAATGTTHLMAISGLHIGIVAGLAFILGRLATRWPGAQHRRITAPDAGAAASLIAAVLYAALAGFTLPTVRALAMLVVHLVARWRRRNVAPHAVLTAAAGTVLLIDPFAPLSAGAWLSFGAVAVIFLGLAGNTVHVGRMQAFLRIQAWVTVGLVPILVAAFGGISTVAPVANLVAIPLFGLVVIPLVLTGVALSAVWPAAGAPALDGAAWVLDRFLPVLDWLAASPPAMLRFPAPGAVGTCALGVAAALVLVPAAWPLRATALLALVALLVRVPLPPAKGEVEVAVLDVGQGLAVVARTRSHTLVYDTGPAFRGGRDTGALVVVPYLRAAGVTRLDGVIASHGDLDHIGGLRSLLDALPTKKLTSSEPLPPGLPASRPCARGQSWRWDAVRFRFLHPAPGAPRRASDNDRSCVLEISSGDHRLLLTGDIEADAEAQLVRENLLTAVDLLVAPHHGSRTSSSDPFVEATRPSLVVFASGYRNRWHFPHPDVVRRWRNRGARILTTATSGAVIVRMDARGLRSVREYRREDRHYWRVR
jgi:competence protein ComEC